MVTVSLFLALALVSSTVVAQPGENSIAEEIAYLYRMMNLEIPTKSIYEWIPPNERAPAPTSDEDPVKIGLSYLVQKLSLQSNEFKMSTSFTDHFGGHPCAAADCLKVPCHHDTAPVMEYHPTGNKDTPHHLVFTIILTAIFPIYATVSHLTVVNPGGGVSRKRFKMGFAYKVVNLPNESPNDGFSTIVNPENFQSSPEGWTEGYKTIGNNVEVNAEGGTPFETTTKGVFDGIFDPTPPSQTPRYTAAGNFQKNNFNKGGKGRDPVIINVQSSKEKNGAEFSASLDGYRSVLTIYISTATEPSRDPALDNTVVIHELTHGLTDRLTGGAQTKICMTDTESLGLSEGYSDIVAIIFTAKLEDTRNTEKVIGEYVEGDSQGLHAAEEEDPHRLGTIWATMLWEVYWNFVDAHGFSANLHDATQKEGNIIFLQLLVGTLMIQPCDPTFISARDAMLATDYAYYNGVHEHLIRQGFFKRGLGSISQSDPTTDNVV
ncbi:hypothetical protein BASA60_005090 [Batrachochytrium salamandrivorans]|nr:hypothetical protein BASA60_005090 [Batrachochytrium salamandrivorans]